MRYRFFYSFLLLLLNFSSCEKNNKSVAQIDQYISQIKGQYGIPGIALAVIKDGKLVYKNNYGNANIEHHVLVSDSSVFRIYSLTKPIIATAMFQLIEQNKLSLNDEISTYIEGLPITWKNVKIKNLLRHSSGLPDIKKHEHLPEDEAKEKVYNDSINFVQNSKFQYNQTNYWLLLRIIEKITNQKLENFIIQNQFSNTTKQEDVYFSTDSRDIEKNRVSLYTPFNDGKFQIDNPYRKRYLTGANGLNITLNQFIKWDKGFTNNRLLNESYKNRMWESVEFANDNRKWAYGWNKHIQNNHVSYGFSGSMVTAYRNFPKDKVSIIYLSNGFKKWYDVEIVIDHLANLVFNDIEIKKENN